MSKEKVETDLNNNGLRNIAPGTIGFNIKAKDTEQNQAVHSGFREFCKSETDNNYTLGIQKLLEFYESDFKYSILYENIRQLQVAIDDLKSSVVTLQEKPKDNKKDDGTF